MKINLSLLIVAVVILSVGCKKNNDTPQVVKTYTIPNSYNFTGIDSGSSKIILSMVAQIEAVINGGNTSGNVVSATQLKSMLANTGSYFRDTTIGTTVFKLNTSGIQLKSLITPAAEPYVESIFDSLALSSQSTKVAANGIAGVSDRKTLLSANGVYWRQLFTKTMMGVLLQHLTTDVYLTDTLNSGVSVITKTASWDHAFYLWGVPVDFPTNRTAVKYWGSYSSQIDSGVNKPVVNLTGVNANPTLMKAFLTGRVALNNADVFTAQSSASEMVAIYEKMEAAAALHEMNEAIGNLATGASAVAGNISESMGFIKSWKYNAKRKIATDAQVSAIEAMYGTNFYTLTQANLESIKSAISTIYGWDAVKSYL